MVVQSVLLHCVFCREPNGLKLLMKLYVERSHSLWKEPEVVIVIMHAQDSETALYIACQNWGYEKHYQHVFGVGVSNAVLFRHSPGGGFELSFLRSDSICC